MYIEMGELFVLMVKKGIKPLNIIAIQAKLL